MDIDEPSSHFAEQYSQIIFAIMSSWRHSDSEVTSHNARSVGSHHSGGLYLFYLQNNEDVKCPIYIGYTRRTFRKCFQEHVDSGVIEKCLSGKFPTGQGRKFKLFVLQFPMGHVVAKVIESIFLDAYDFALNNHEHYDARSQLYLKYSYRPEESLEWFREIYKSVMDELYSINKDKFALMRYNPITK